MAATPRATRINKLVASVKKQYKPATPPKERTLLEHLLFACLLQNSTHEAAEKAFDRLQSSYFDWNEVRVSTRREMAQVLKELNDPDDAADRLKRTLQNIFEGLYTFDLEPLKKQNLGQTVKQLESYKGITPFVVAYATQTSLGGHSIPVNEGLMTSFLVLDIVSEKDAKNGSVPGLERAIPKSKGVEVGSLLHQLGVEVGKNPYGKNARQLLLSIDPGCKDRLPKRPTKPQTPVAKKPAAKKKPSASKEAPAAKTPPAKKSPAAKKTVKKTSAPKAEAKPRKKAAPAKPAAKKKAKKTTKKTPAKRKPK